MRKITFEISEVLLDRMDQAVAKGGFHSRSEFLRFLIIDHTKSNASESTNGNDVETTDSAEAVVDEFADVDLEFGIPVEVIEKIKKIAGVSF